MTRFSTCRNNFAAMHFKNLVAYQKAKELWKLF
jgi:hypothetical protein